MPVVSLGHEAAIAVLECPRGLHPLVGQVGGEGDDLAEVAPLAQRSAELGNRRWGLIMRTGNDKSMLARQMESYADIYFARVSDLAAATPYAYFRSARGTKTSIRSTTALSSGA